jgi:hypothetical protein
MMTIELPNSWHEIEIGKFPLIYDIVRDNDLEDTNKKIRVLSILSGLSVNELMKINIDSINKLIEEIQFIFKMEFPKEVEKFTYDKYMWYVNYDITNLSAGDFISLSKLTENEDTIINNLPEIMALFIKPFEYKWFKKKEIELDYKEKVALIKQMSVGIVYPIAVFFCSVIASLQTDIEDYLENQSQEVMKILESELNSKSMQNIGVGI